MPDKMAIEQIYLRKYPGQAEIRSGELTRRRSYLISLGFNGEWVEAVSKLKPTLYDPVIIDDHFA